MLHYRQTFRSNGSRLLIAAMLATMLHLGLMNIQFVSGSIFVPNVSLPHSVSILLTRKSSIREAKTSLNEDINRKKVTVPAEEKTILPAVKKILAEPEADVKSVHPPAVVTGKDIQRPTAPAENRGEVPAVDAPVQVQESTKNSPVEVQHADVSAETANHHAAIRPGRQTGDDDNMASHAGALQKAYPRYQLNEPPVYPNLARKRGQQGTVVLQVLVNGQGRVDDLRLNASSGHSMLDRAAVAAVKKWIFEPGRQGNKTVPMWVRVPVTFELKNR